MCLSGSQDLRDVYKGAQYMVFRINNSKSLWRINSISHILLCVVVCLLFHLSEPGCKSLKKRFCDSYS